MYQALLTRRYLTSKVMPLLAAVAVTLCVAMELIVWSVMGGFLVMLVESGRTLIGDVSVSPSHLGFAYYEDLIKRLEADPQVAAACPLIESFGLISLPQSNTPDTVVIKGIDARFNKVTDYANSLWWKPLDKPLPKDKKREDPRLAADNKAGLEKFYQQGLSLTAPRPAPGRTRAVEGQAGLPMGALVIGIEVGGYNLRHEEGYREPYFFLPGSSATLSVLPMDARGRVLPEQKTRVFPIANQFTSGIYEIDNNTVFVRLDELQKMLMMDRAERVDPASAGASPDRVVDPKTGKEIWQEPKTIVEPARVTHVLVRGKDGVDSNVLRDRCRGIYDSFAADHANDPLPPQALGKSGALTWRDRNRTLIDAVENETSLVLFIFGIISLTSVFLVLAIFWAMVSEKTKDIGVLRAIGASRGGVAWIWLRYGLAIGVVGAVLGGTIAYLIVTNINPIHEWLGRNLGIVIWNPKVYYFTIIPNRVEWPKALIVMCSGMVASVVGALVPAIKAAFMDPVKALRFE